MRCGGLAMAIQHVGHLNTEISHHLPVALILGTKPRSAVCD